MVVGPGEAVKAGGFLTGWKGIAIFISMITVAVILAITGIQAERNTFPRLSPAESSFSGGDYGLGPLYAQCITNGSFEGKQWVFDVPIPGSDRRSVETVPLGDRRLLSQLSGGAISSSVRWNNNPEFVCFVICRMALGDRCTYFTYDGLDADSCRFGDPTYPMKPILPSGPEDFLFVYNATCMQRRREQLVAPIETPATDLERPNGRTRLGNTDEAVRLSESLLENTVFLRGQWAGPLPADYVQRGGYEWREPGFTDLDVETCGREVVEGSFATGDHVIVTMATANQVAVMSLALTWWKDTIGQLGGLGVRADRDEILRGAAYLIRAWEPGQNDIGRLMLGVGDQLTRQGVPEMYSDFGSAGDALQTGAPPFENGQPAQVAPKCQYARNAAPDPATAAHAAAALALGSVAVAELSAGGPVSPDTMLEAAAELYEYSVTNQPLDGPAFPAFNATREYGASQLYPLDEGSPLQVYSHQLWAACALFQATGDERYWNDTLAIYDAYFDALDTELDGSPLYNPSANYRNPQWYALLCMAQSAPEASNIAADPLLAVPEHVDPSAEVEANETAAGWGGGQRDKYRQYLLAQLPETGTRMEVTRQLRNNFVWPWLTLESQAAGRPGADPEFEPNTRLRASSPDSFHFFDLNDADDDDPIGTATVIRDSANAALVSLVWADLPGVDEETAFQARCMAKQQVDFVLGENSGEMTLQAFFGDEAVTVTNFWHKDSACPGLEIRNSSFSPVREPNPDFDPDAVNPGLRVTFRTRRCDFLTFFGNNTDPADNPELQEALGAALPPVLDPVLDPNPNDLVGAVAATFDVTGESGTFFVNQRAVCANGDVDVTTCRLTEGATTQVPNPMTQVSIDTNAAFFGAVAGVIALPAAFWDRVDECPSPQDRTTEAKAARDRLLRRDSRSVESPFIVEATADPNEVVPTKDNGLRVPLLEGTPAPVDDSDGDDDVVDDAAEDADAEAEEQVAEEQAAEREAEQEAEQEEAADQGRR